VIELIAFSVAGIALLVLLYFFAVRTDVRPEGGAEALLEARQALNSLQSGLLPADLVERIFARDDLDFVSATCSNETRELFLRERRKTALCWIAQVRAKVLSLQRFYSGQSRNYAQLDFRTELNLGLGFASLLISCRILQAAFYLRGPYAAPTVVARTLGAAADLCATSAQSLSFLAHNVNAYHPSTRGAGIRGLD
jgi:hypothetical protein